MSEDMGMKGCQMTWTFEFEQKSETFYILRNMKRFE